MALIYVACPIDRSGEYRGDIEKMVEQVSNQIEQVESVAYRPIEAFRAGDLFEDRIQKANNVVLDMADGLLAVWPEGCPSIGVPMEIERALAAGLDVAIVNQMGRIESAALAGRPIDMLRPEDVDWWVDGMGGRVESKSVIGVCSADPRVVSRMPERTHVGDAGFDLFVSQDVSIPSGGVANVPHNVRLGFPSGVWGMLVGRSSTFNRGLVCNTAIIDQGYRGPLYTVVLNESDDDVVIRQGERISQIIPMSVLADTCRMEPVDDLGRTERGEAGFGSSGM